MVGLAEIFNKWGTDKAQAATNPIWHGYAGIYECLLHRHREQVRTVLEIGIGTMIEGAHSTMVGWALKGYQPGGSLRAWREYFVNASVYGIDVQPDTRLDAEERIKTSICDLTDAAQVRALFGKEFPSSFDLIIDDGSHLLQDQLRTMENLFPYVARCGIYVVEDVVDGRFDQYLDRIKEICGDNPCFLLGSDCKLFACIRANY